MYYSEDTIIALATAPGTGAIAVIRLSGKEAIATTAKMFNPRDKTTDLTRVASHSIHLGWLVNGGEIVDEVLVSVFRNPRSYTGEDVVEISCHGSRFIQESIVQLFIDNGIRHAEAGEFTLRAFLNGKMDLSQTEAVADLIDSQNKVMRDIAIKQMRGGFSNDLQNIRKKLVHFASLIELELDFAEEDVVFVKREDLLQLVDESIRYLQPLITSFQLGNAIKNGVTTTIVGAPNAGKSTLLNALINEERAIVTDIAGTTRDTLEEVWVIEGITFRFIDTAGLRETSDTIEKIGVAKALEKVAQSSIYIYVFDASNKTVSGVISELKTLPRDIPHLIVANKSDLIPESVVQNIRNSELQHYSTTGEILFISARQAETASVKKALLQLIQADALQSGQSIVTNARHYEALSRAKQSLETVKQGLRNNLSGDLLSVDIRQALDAIGSITGEITSDDLLGNIFKNFCIGK